MESQVKVETENECQEEEVEVRIGGYEISDSRGDDPSDLGILNVENIKKEKTESLDKYECNNDDLSKHNDCHINTEFIIKDEEISCEETNEEDADVTDGLKNYDKQDSGDIFNKIEEPTRSVFSENLFETKFCINSLQQTGSNISGKEPLNHLSHTNTLTQEKSFDCEERTKSLSQSSGPDEYINIHTGGKPFKCEECNKSFSYERTLKNRMCSYTEQSPFECKECDESFSLEKDLQKHMQTHTGRKSFACKECCKSFSQPSYLRRHERSHAGRKPYKCKECSKSFAFLDQCQSHMVTHPTVDSFKCNDCCMSFPKLSHLMSHMRSHKGSDIPIQVNNSNIFLIPVGPTQQNIFITNCKEIKFLDELNDIE